MAGKPGRRTWGWVRRLPSKQYQASYIHPPKTQCRHTAPHTFGAKIDAEGWLSTERRAIELGTWTAPAARVAAVKARAVSLDEYAQRWLSERSLKPRTASLYASQLRLHILPKLGAIPVENLTGEQIRHWYASLGREHARRNSQVYGLLHAVCATAVLDGLLPSNPCLISGAMNVQRKREPVIPTMAELATLADAIKPERFRAMILAAAWCGLRWGEVTELRRSDIGVGCEVLRVERGVTYSDGAFVVGPPKSGKPRTLVVPPHIRAALKHHLDVHTGPEAEALLFPNTTGGHLNDTVFRRGSFRPALKAIGREGDGIRVHDLRHFAGTHTARVANLVETMGRMGHSTAKASLLYQQQVSGRDVEIAAALSRLAEGSAAE
jgi:integrase